MRTMLTSALLLASSAAVLTAWTACSDSSGGSANTITILWAEWEPANALQTLSEEYTKATGVKVVVDKIGWEKISDVKSNEFNNKGKTYDIIIGDSQWLGQGATGGHYLPLTDFIKSNEAIFKDVSPRAMQFYSEYPPGSGKYYAVPCESDAMAFAYRKDLFEDAKHKTQFKAFAAANGKADAELQVPKTWDELLLISRYFKEASGIPDMAGFIAPTTPGYDQAVMSFQPLLWSFGGDWGDYAKGTVTIKSPDAVAALAFMKQLVGTTSSTGVKANYGDVTTAYASGKVAMAMTYMAFFPSFTSQKENKNFFDKTGYFNVPAGPRGRFTSLGGQGMSVNAHVDKARQDKALAFIKWFSAEDVQMKWAKAGGYSANTRVLKSDAFKNATPYNFLFEEAFGLMKDFWNNPQYDQLLTIARDNVSAVIQGQKEPQAAVDEMQREQEKVMSGK